MKNCPSNKILNPITNRCVLRSGLIGKKILKNHINKITSSKCNKINLQWENNSCYVDSLLVALFINKDEFIKKYLLNAPINNYGLCELNLIGKKIREVLNNIYDYINNPNEKRGITCYNLRLLLNKYYKILKTVKKIDLIGTNDNWLNSQNDVFELFEFFKVIFNIKDTTKFIDANNPPNYTDFSFLLPIDFLLDTSKPVKINKLFPKTNIKYQLENKKNYNKTTEILKAEKLFIKIYRNIGSNKLDTKIIPTKSLKLKENDFDLILTSMIIHYGSNKGGHYTCLYCCDSIWYEYNDISRNITKIGSLKDVYNNSNYSSNIVGLIYSKV